MKILRGDLFWCNFDPSFGHEQGRVRPCVVLQIDSMNKYNKITVVAPITSKIYEDEFPFHVILENKNSGLKKDSTVLLNQVKAVDKRRILKRIGSLNYYDMKQVEEALKFNLGLN